MSYLTTGEAARMCGVAVNSIKRWIRQGRIPHIQTPGGHWRIPRREFLRFMDTLQPQAGPEPLPRILIIDDDPQVCDILSSALASGASFPHETSCAHDGYTGLIQIGRWRPSLLVLDIVMPGINGLELLHRLHAVPELRGDMRIIVSTAADDRPLVMRKIEEAKPDAILLKPVGVETFLHTVSSLLWPTPAVHGKGR